LQLWLTSTYVNNISPPARSFPENPRDNFFSSAKLQERGAALPAKQGLNLVPLDQ
jgi:hypothetical protein